MNRRLLVIAVAVLPCSLHAQTDTQTDTTARLVGTARSSLNGRPLPGVMVAVPAVQRFVVTDSTGRFEFNNLPAGRQLVRIAYEGRATSEYEITLPSRRTHRISVMLDVEAIDLDPIVVSAKAVNSLAGFYDRKKIFGGFGRFFTQEDIDQLRALRISDVLRREGIWVRCDPSCVPTRYHRGYLCAVPVIVDGLPFADFDFDNIAVSDVLGIEVYRGGAIGDPPGLNPRSVAGSGGTSYQPFRALGNCGSVYIWTR